MTALAVRTAGGYVHPPPSTELVAGGEGASLPESYEVCRRLHAAHGRTYYFATRFLPADRRHHVHALYGFARYADDLVDHMALSWPVERRRAALEAWSAQLLTVLDAVSERSERRDASLVLDAVSERSERRDASWPLGVRDPVLRAVLVTVVELGVRRSDLEAFLSSMAMDLTVTRYGTYDELYEYVYGSAAVIGSMMLPVLGTTSPEARARAMDLGVAFQLTNFLRDVAEDWDRGRLYLPLEDLDRFGVTEWDFRSRHVGPPLRRLLAFEAARTRALYRRAEEGWALLPPASQACIRVAHRLYGGILDALEAGDYQVFRRRVSVGPARKVSVAIAELVRPSRPGQGHLP